MRQKGSIEIIILVGALVLAAIAGTLYLRTQKQDTPSPVVQITPAPTPTPDTIPVPIGTGETANWKTYYSNVLDAYFKYPSNWSVTSEVREVEGSERTYTYLKGPEGAITIPSGDLGGGCQPTQEVTFPFGEKLLVLCYEKHDDETVEWSPVYGNPVVPTFSFDAFVNPGKGNAEVITTIFSTFKFTQ